MILLLLGDLVDRVPALNVFRYITFRTGGALMSALLIAFFAGAPMIAWLKSRQALGQPIRSDGPPRHITEKAGTPTMGGLLILLAFVPAVLFWADLANLYIWIVLAVMLGFGALGCADDLLKLTRHSVRGLSGRFKLAIQALISLAAAAAFLFAAGPQISQIAVPFFKNVLIPLAFLFPLFIFFVIAGAANSVNLTDGLDGLAIVPVMIAAACFGIIAYLSGHALFADYLQIHFVPGAGELAVLCSAIIGAGLGFLWFNAPPAKVFMGDTGALALGAALGAVAVATRHELVLVIVGGLFVFEAVSVIAQVVSFKLTGRRIFRMAPFHHHLEKKGWEEATIVIRLWIISCVLALAGLSTLKLR